MLKKLFGWGKDDETRDKDRVQREDRRGTGDEAPEHSPAVVADPEEAGHTPDPVAGTARSPEEAGHTPARAAGAAPHGRPAAAEMERRGQGDMAPGDQRWFAGDERRPDAPYRPDPPNHNPYRDEGRSLEDEAEILADDLIGQKPTTEGTAGRDWTEPPARHPD